MAAVSSGVASIGSFESCFSGFTVLPLEATSDGAFALCGILGQGIRVYVGVAPMYSLSASGSVNGKKSRDSGIVGSTFAGVGRSTRSCFLLACLV